MRKKKNVGGALNNTTNTNMLEKDACKFKREENYIL